MGSRHLGATRALAAAAIAGQVVFVCSWVLAAALAPGYSAWRQGVSELGALHASHPWIVNAGLIVLGLSFLALGVSMRSVLPARRASLVAAVLFGLTGVALALSGVFRLDCGLSSHLCRARLDAGQLSWHTSAHVWSGPVASLALLLTPFAIARALWPSPPAAAALGAGAFGVAVGIAGEIAYQASAPAGISERLQLLAAQLWVVLVAGGILYATRRRSKTLQVTLLRPRDFFAGSWAGDGEFTAWPPLLGRLIHARFALTRKTTFLSDQVWIFDDTATFAGGTVLAQRLICQLDRSGRIHVTADCVPGGCEVLLEDRGYRLTPYRYLIEVGPLHFTVRCRDQHRVEADGTLLSTVRARWLGLPVATLRARARRSDQLAGNQPRPETLTSVTS